MHEKQWFDIELRLPQTGGWWIHLGPLQWHWADAHTYLDTPEPSLEVTLVDVQRIAMSLGFVFDKKETGIHCRYMSDVRGMVHQTYSCAFWTAQKVDNTYEADNTT